jgi:hypothetical protein
MASESVRARFEERASRQLVAAVDRRGAGPRVGLRLEELVDDHGFRSGRPRAHERPRVKWSPSVGRRKRHGLDLLGSRDDEGPLTLLASGARRDSAASCNPTGVR